MFLSKKMVTLGLACVVALSLSACGSEQAKPAGAVKPVKMDLNFFTTPSVIKAGEEVRLRLAVTRTGKIVQDAEVEYEIWREGDKRTFVKELAPYVLGMYELKKKYTTPGVYHIIPHTTSQDMHQMPTLEFTVVE